MAQRKGYTGRWFKSSELIAENNTPLCMWNLYSNIFPDEKAHDREVKAYIKQKDDKYYLVNLKLDNLLSPDRNTVPKGYAFELSEGMAFRLVSDDNSLLLKVELFENI